MIVENLQTKFPRGSRSRNKVYVGEPAEGSLSALEVSLQVLSSSYVVSSTNS